MIELKGKDAAAAVKKKAADIAKELPRMPRLAIFRVGERPGDLAYERGAKKTLESLGMEAVTYVFPEKIDTASLTSEIEKTGKDAEVDGILVLSPLPKHIDMDAVWEAVPASKDVDGATPENRFGVYMGEPGAFAPCTASAVLEILEYAGIEVSGKKVTIIGYGPNIGRPLSQMLIGRKATVSVCRSKTPREDAAALCRMSDIIVAAAGIAGFVDSNFIPNGAAVIDVGINAKEDGGICGDVDWEAAKEHAAFATPVPGGVGSVTTAVLALHLAYAAQCNFA